MLSLKRLSLLLSAFLVLLVTGCYTVVDFHRPNLARVIDEGEYVWPAQCPVCERKCVHNASSKWVRMEIIGNSDVDISKMIESLQNKKWVDYFSCSVEI